MSVSSYDDSSALDMERRAAITSGRKTSSARGRLGSRSQEALLLERLELVGDAGGAGEARRRCRSRACSAGSRAVSMESLIVASTLCWRGVRPVASGGPSGMGRTFASGSSFFAMAAPPAVDWFHRSHRRAVVQTFVRRRVGTSSRRTIVRSSACIVRTHALPSYTCSIERLFDPPPLSVAPSRHSLDHHDRLIFPRRPK